MRKLLMTGGTVFVSRYIARYFAAKGDEVTVLNRNSRPQEPGVRLIQADRHALGDALRGLRFDAVIDVTAYTADDVAGLLGALDHTGRYVLISSSAVYPETAPQPFREDTPLGPNRFWGAYGTDKIGAEKALTSAVSDAVILRPPYLYGPMNNVYREAFVFDCAMAGRPFYLPQDGQLRLQFLHVRDLCRVIDAVLDAEPAHRVLNVGNAETVTVRDWVTLCYACAGRTPTFVSVPETVPQRSYFSFHPYEYALDVRGQTALIGQTVPLEAGLREAFQWHLAHPEDVRRKPFLDYIDAHLRSHSAQLHT